MRWGRAARKGECVSLVSLVWNVGAELTGERDRNKEKQKHEGASVAPLDRPSQAIHYSRNASQCQLYYGKAIPDWRPRVGGEKWQQNTAPCPGRKQGSCCDGWMCLTQAGWKVEMGLFQMRQGVGRVSAPPCSEHLSLVRMRGILLSCFRQCFYHLCQNRRSPYSTDKTGPRVIGILKQS